MRHADRVKLARVQPGQRRGRLGQPRRHREGLGPGQRPRDQHLPRARRSARRPHQGRVERPRRHRRGVPPEGEGDRLCQRQPGSHLWIPVTGKTIKDRGEPRQDRQADQVDRLQPQREAPGRGRRRRRAACDRFRQREGGLHQPVAETPVSKRSPSSPNSKLVAAQGDSPTRRSRSTCPEGQKATSFSR